MWTLPASLKRKSFTTTLPFGSTYDPFEDDAYLDQNLARKRNKHERYTGEWRYVERTPSPEKEPAKEDDREQEEEFTVPPNIVVPAEQTNLPSQEDFEQLLSELSATLKAVPDMQINEEPAWPLNSANNHLEHDSVVLRASISEHEEQSQVARSIASPTEDLQYVSPPTSETRAILSESIEARGLASSSERTDGLNILRRRPPSLLSSSASPPREESLLLNIETSQTVTQPHTDDGITTAVTPPDQPHLQPLDSASLPQVSPLLSRISDRAIYSGSSQGNLHDAHHEPNPLDQASARSEEQLAVSNMENVVDIGDGGDHKSQHGKADTNDHPAQAQDSEYFAQGQDRFSDLATRRFEQRPIVARQPSPEDLQHHELLIPEIMGNPSVLQYEKNDDDHVEANDDKDSRSVVISEVDHEQGMANRDEVEVIDEIEVIEINSDSESTPDDEVWSQEDDDQAYDAEYHEEFHEEYEAEFDEDCEYENEEEYLYEQEAENVTSIDLEDHSATFRRDAQLWDMVDLENEGIDQHVGDGQADTHNISQRHVQSTFTSQDIFTDSQHTSKQPKISSQEIITDQTASEDVREQSFGINAEANTNLVLSTDFHGMHGGPLPPDQAVSDRDGSFESVSEYGETVQSPRFQDSEPSNTKYIPRSNAELNNVTRDLTNETHLLTPVPTQLEETVEAESFTVLETTVENRHQAPTPEPTQSLSNEYISLGRPEALERSSLFDRLRKQRVSSSNGNSREAPQLQSVNPWFTPRHLDSSQHESQVGDDEEEEDEEEEEEDDDDARSALHEDQVEEQDHTRASSVPSTSAERPLGPPFLDASEALPTPPATNFRSSLSYFAPVSTIAEHFGTEIDVFAIAVSSTMPARAQSGPRDHFLTLYLLDQSSNISRGASLRPARIFRPAKAALPIVNTGDAILLRNFKIESSRKKFVLVSTNSSAWAVFRKGEDVQVQGPPVEFGSEEAAFAVTLQEWWRGLDEEIRDGLQDAASQMQAQDAMKPKSKDRQSIGTLMDGVHELRDGTRYTDEGGDVKDRVHELRDGTTYMDDVG